MMLNLERVFPANFLQKTATNVTRFDEQELRLIVDKILALDLSKCQIPYLSNLVGKLTAGYTLYNSVINPNAYLYRGILYNDKPKNASFLSYPPIDKAKINRASKEGEQMFYAATDPFVPYYEVNAKKGDTIAISRWRVKMGLSLNSVGFTEDMFKKLQSIRTPFSRLGNDKHTNSPENVLVHNFLAEQFCQSALTNVEIYRLTNAIADQLKSRIFDGLNYPTIAMDANADNVALFPEVVDRQLSLEAVAWERVEVVEPGSRTFGVRSLDYANSFEKNGKINWSGKIRSISPMSGYAIPEYRIQWTP